MFNYLLEINPSTEFQYASLCFAVLSVVFLCSFLLSFLITGFDNQALRKSLKKTPTFLRSAAGVMLVMTWARIAGVSYLSMRLWWIILLLVILYWFYRVFRRYRSLEKRIARFANEIKQQKNKNKYLPKKRKR